MPSLRAMKWRIDKRAMAEDKNDMTVEEVVAIAVGEILEQRILWGRVGQEIQQE